MLEQSEKEFHGEEGNNTPPAEGQGEQATRKVVAEEDYKSLQAEYTKTNQDRINTYIELARRDKSYIESIQDKKIQDKVINSLYSLSNLDEAKAIYWNNFLTKADESEGEIEQEDKADKLEKEIRLMKWQQGKREMEAEIWKLQEKNKNLLSPEDIEKVKEELKWISDELPLEERVKRAGDFVLRNKYTDEDLAYKMLKEKWGASWSGSLHTNEAAKNVEIDSIFEWILKHRKRK